MKRWLFWISMVLLGLVGLVACVLLVTFLWVKPVGSVKATVAQNKALPHETIDGVTFHLRRFGSHAAPVVLVLHGGPGGDFRSLLPMKKLAQDGYQVIFYDQRGTGLSPRVPASQLTLASSVEDLHKIVKWAGKGKPVALFGHSWGGIIAAFYLAKYPSSVSAAILAEPGVLTSEELQAFVALMQPKINLPTLWYMIKTVLAANKIKGPDKEASADYLLHKMMTMPGGDNPLKAYWCGGKPPKGAMQFWRVGATASEGILGDARQPDGSYKIPSLDGLKKYKHEVLLLAGSCNTLIGPKRQQAHLKLFSKATLKVIPNAGHMMYLDQPKLTFEAVRAYLKRRGVLPKK